MVFECFPGLGTDGQWWLMGVDNFHNQTKNNLIAWKCPWVVSGASHPRLGDSRIVFMFNQKVAGLWSHLAVLLSNYWFLLNVGCLLNLMEGRRRNPFRGLVVYHQPITLRTQVTRKSTLVSMYFDTQHSWKIKRKPYTNTRELPGVALVNCAISHIFTIIWIKLLKQSF